MAMLIKDMEPIAPGNPFRSDPIHMGQYIGRNVCIMYSEHTDRHQPYIIVIDMTTGERKEIWFSSAQSDHNEPRS